MAKILGLDLGTNSIGWAIRDTDIEGNQFVLTNKEDEEKVNAGVVIFKKGVGEGKSGEYSLAAERRKNRSKRRLYNAKRYRKWATLKVLLENNMCPICIEELRLWSIGNWKEIDGSKKNIGRLYPTSPDFIAWLAMDFNKIGNEWEGEKLQPEFTNPYELRAYLLETNNSNDLTRLYKIGRAFYHLVQRRGFKTSRKSGKSAYGENEYLEVKIKENPELKASQILQNGLVNENRRIRNSGVIQRRYFEEELLSICKKQNLSESLTEKIHQAIYFVRPLRTQKGLVGKCTLEKGKTRIPISHPTYEEFRALAYINTIKWRNTGSKEAFEPIPITLKRKILKDIFFKTIKHKNGIINVNDRNYFEFKEIVDNYSEGHSKEFNYAKYKDEKYELASNPNVSTCPVIAGLMNVFENEWKNKFIDDETRFGIEWQGLNLNYKIKYGTCKQKGIGFIEKKIGEERNIDKDGIWHILFDYLQTKDNEDKLRNFCKNVLEWDYAKIDMFVDISISQGYGSLSYCAIRKILPFLQDGYIYSEAVSFANLKNVIGKQLFDSKLDDIKIAITKTIKEIDQQKELLNITNGLIQQYFAENNSSRPKGLDEHIIDIAKMDTVRKLTSYFGEENWNKKTDEEKSNIESFVFEKYTCFLDGKQKNEEKASFKHNKVVSIDYYKLPRLDEAIKSTLKNQYGIKENSLKKLYHPSDIDIYPISKSGRLENPNPPSKGWKNPMAMRTMYELRKLVNYLLDTGKIDEETRIVVEMARENNSANYRKAYIDWTKDRENENKIYAKEIVELISNVNIDEISDDDYDKFRSAVEQISQFEFSENKNNAFNEKYKQFIATFLSNNKTKEEDIVEEKFDYLMYLILCRDEFSKYLNYKIPNTQKYGNQVIVTSKDYSKKRKELQEMLLKYRLWQQQRFQCLYTGAIIPFTQLFSNNFQIEHTVPRSISFDSELKNLTICDSVYNNVVKSNKFPTECPNYSSTKVVQTNNGLKECTAIKGRVDRMIRPKVLELRNRIENLKRKSSEIPDWEKYKKDLNIQLRQYLKFELEYWEDKLFTFTVEKKDWKSNWKNSQLIDTQIISKYARAYLKTTFHKVDVQKGKTTSEFRKIYNVYGAEKKDRGKHCHHAVDAAVLTLIPGSARRDAILEGYYHAQEHYAEYHQQPYDNFSLAHIQNIENSILINHVTKDQTLCETKKKVRKRGRIELLDNKTPKVMQGVAIRGQLHKESYFGAIKVNERNSDGFPIKKDNEYVVKQEKDQDEIWIVIRKPIENIDFNKDIIIDELLRKHLLKQFQDDKKVSDLVDFNNKPIRHLRCRVKAGRGYLQKETAIPIKEHIFKSKHTHKQEYLVQNDENYLFLLYEGVKEKKKEKINSVNDLLLKHRKDNEEIIRGYRILNLFDVTKLKIKDVNQIREINEFQYLEKGNTILKLKAILKVGDRILLYEKDRNEIMIDNYKERLFEIYKFNVVTPTGYLYCQNHIEARPDNELGDGETEFNSSKYQPRLKLSSDNFNCLIENIDFKINYDGSVEFIH